MFPAKRKRIFMNLFLRNSSCLQRCSILLIFNLLQPGFHCIFQIFLCFRILNLELNNKCIIALLAPTSHRIFRIHSPGSKSQYNNPPVLQSAPEQMVQTSDLLLFSIFLSCISFQNFLEPIQNHDTIIEPEYI